MYRKGEYVVKANTGVCVVEDILLRRLTENFDEKEYYCLVPIADSRTRVFVPVDSDKSNLRKAMDKKEAEALIHAIPSIETKWIENDKSREQEYKNAMRSNDPVALVAIIKNLYSRNRDRLEHGKKVTSIDDRYYKLAEYALYSEIAHALDKNTEEMRELISNYIT